MKIFVTGHLGYIGTHLVSLLKKEGHFVTGCDLNLFADSACEPIERPDQELQLDIRQLTPSHLIGYDCVMHLAAISNDPMGELDPAITKSINCDASIQVAINAKKAGVPRFLFASSCSIYGQAKMLDLNESAPLHPQSAYAASKIDAEKGIESLADNEFSPVFLRNATAYGHSSMLRLDLVVNNLLAFAYTGGEIRIMSDGLAWRPLIHAKDIARAFIAFFHAPRPLIHNRAVNIGANQENYQVREIAEKILRFVPNAQVVYAQKNTADSRNYRVNFDLLTWLLPDFKLEYTLEQGIEELHRSFHRIHLNRDDFEGGKFTRLFALKKQMNLVMEKKK